MATIQYKSLTADVNLDIKPIFTDLMKASTGRGSAYLKAKETVIDYAARSNLTEIEKATLVSQTVTQLAQSVTNEAMQIALKIATENRDAPYSLAKIKEDTRRVTAEIANAEKTNDNLGTDNDIKVMQVKKAQAELYRDYGVLTSSLGSDKELGDGSFDDYGSKVEAIKMAKATRYNTYATSYRQNGVVTLALSTKGELLKDSTYGDENGLLTQQYKVALRQESAFDDNMRQHAANSSASMISMLLSTDASIDNPDQYTDMWKTSVNYLNGVNS